MQKLDRTLSGSPGRGGMEPSFGYAELSRIARNGPVFPEMQLDRMQKTLKDYRSGPTSLHLRHLKSAKAPGMNENNSQMGDDHIHTAFLKAAQFAMNRFGGMAE